MKRIIFKIALILFVCVTSNAQSNLEFNRVIKEKYIYASSSPVTSSLIVPAGKVLKITSATVTPIQSSYTGGGEVLASIDGQVVAYSYFEKSNIYQTIMRETAMTSLPLWLPSGTYQITATTSASGLVTFSYCGIEFNIVP